MWTEGPGLQEAVDTHMQELYGDARKRSALFAESAAQLQLEAAAGSAATAGAAASAPQRRPVPPAGDMLAARLAPEQNGAAELQHAVGQRAHAQADGISLHPAAAAHAPQPSGNAAERVRGPAMHAGRGQVGLNAPGSNAAGGPAEASARPRSAVGDVARRHAASAAHSGPELALAEPARQPRAGAALGRLAPQPQVPPPSPARRLAVQLAPDALALRDASAARLLEAINPADGPAGSMRSQLVCSCGAERLWDVTLHDRVVMLCGAGANFVAAAMQGGTLEVSLLLSVQSRGMSCAVRPSGWLAWYACALSDGGPCARYTRQLGGCCCRPSTWAPAQHLWLRMTPGGCWWWPLMAVCGSGTCRSCSW